MPAKPVEPRAVWSTFKAKPPATARPSIIERPQCKRSRPNENHSTIVCGRAGRDLDLLRLRSGGGRGTDLSARAFGSAWCRWWASRRRKAFAGFETADHGVKVLLTELPAAAFGEVEAAFKATPEGVGGIKPENIETAAGMAYYTRREREGWRRHGAALFDDRAGRTFSGYVAVQVPEAAARLFRRGGAQDVRHRRGAQGCSGRRATGADAVQDRPSSATSRMCARWRPAPRSCSPTRPTRPTVEAAPFMVLGLIGAAPEKPDDRGRFAQQAAAQIPGLRDGRITMSEPVRIDGAPGYETRIEATQRQGQHAGQRGAVAAVRQRHVRDADHRQCAARRLAEGVSALPRRARRHQEPLN